MILSKTCLASSSPFHRVRFLEICVLSVCAVWRRPELHARSFCPRASSGSSHLWTPKGTVRSSLTFHLNNNTNNNNCDIIRIFFFFFAVVPRTQGTCLNVNSCGRKGNSYCLVWGATKGGGSERGWGQGILLLLQLQAPPSERETPLLQSRHCAAHRSPAPSPTGTLRPTDTALKTQHCAPRSTGGQLTPQALNQHTHTHSLNSIKELPFLLKERKLNLYSSVACRLIIIIGTLVKDFLFFFTQSSKLDFIKDFMD